MHRNPYDTEANRWDLVHRHTTHTLHASPIYGAAPSTVPTRLRAVLRRHERLLLMDSRVRQAINLLSEDLSRDLDFKAVAVYVNLSSSRLRHLFKEETGLTPAQYLKRLRLERARELLERSFLRLKEVMPQVGINDESHFVRDFKKVHGITPRRYRQHSCKSPSR
jgi:transcriptional regulator GlxA family with amidase domain